MNPLNRPIQRILIVTETFLPKIDGISNTLVHLLEYFYKSGIECQVIAPEGSPDTVFGAKIHTIKSHPFPLYPELQLPSPFVNIQPILKAFQPDIIHTVNPVGLGLVAIRLGLQHQIPVIASYHTDVPGFAEKMGLGMFQDALWKYFRWVHNQASLTLVPSHYTLQQLANRGYKRLGIWSRGVDGTLFQPSRRDEAVRYYLTDGNPTQPLLLFAGRLAMEKRIDWLLPILCANPGVRLAIVGDGPERMKLQNLYANKPAVFTGYLCGDALAAAYASADWFVFPAANETFGNVVLEAMSAGLPVIAADTGGQIDHVHHGRNGLLFVADNIDSLVQTTSRALVNPDLHDYLAQNAFHDTCAMSWESIFAGLIKQYEEVIRKNQKRQTSSGLLKTYSAPKESF